MIISSTCKIIYSHSELPSVNMMNVFDLCTLISNLFTIVMLMWRCKYIFIGNLKNYFVKNHSDCTHKYSEVDIKKMLEFLIDNIYLVFGNQVFQQSVGIPMGTNCAPLLTDLFLYSYEAELIKNLYLKKINHSLWPSTQH